MDLLLFSSVLTTAYKTPKLTISQLYSVYRLQSPNWGQNLPILGFPSVHLSCTLQPAPFGSGVSNAFTPLLLPGSLPSAWEQIPKFKLWGTVFWKIREVCKKQGAP